MLSEPEIHLVSSLCQKLGIHTMDYTGLGGLQTKLQRMSSKLECSRTTLLKLALLYQLPQTDKNESVQ